MFCRRYNAPAILMANGLPSEHRGDLGEDVPLQFPMPAMSGAAPGPAYLPQGTVAPSSEGEAVKEEHGGDSVPSHP